MNIKKRRIGVLTGGGDCAGLNPAIKWVVKTAMDERLEWERGIRYEVLGIRDGWKGLVNVDMSSPDTQGSLTPLNPDIVRTWDRYGGTMLGTSRLSPYDPKNDCSKQVRENIEKLGLYAVIAIGGDGTLAIATRMSKEGVNIIGIPKTIDKDLPETDYTLGYETALNVITEEVDRLRTTAGSHKRIFVVETMGRTAGWLALEGGESCGAYIILIPEYDFSIDRVNELVMEGRRAGTRYEIIVVAEGAKPIGGKLAVKVKGDATMQEILGGSGDFLAQEIRGRVPFEVRVTVLGHIQRGGQPIPFDRILGTRLGVAAVDLIKRGEFGKIAVLRGTEIKSVTIAEATGQLKLVDPTCELIETARATGTEFGV